MKDQRIIFEIHRLANEGLSIRKIAQTLCLNRETVAQYLDDPTLTRPQIQRGSKLDAFKEEIARLLEIDPRASAEVIRQRIAAKGFEGGKSIVKDYLRTIRDIHKKKQPFIRFESAPGEQCQIDWGHFGSITYGNTTRKLYCLALIECHSRMLYLEFTHSQRQDTLHRCLLNAFRFLGGSPKELVHDNMLTAVLERDGSLIRFNEAFLAFLRPFKTVPLACNVRQAHEKGKVEKGAIHYIRYNFWPLRSFKDLADVQAQAGHWRDSIANVRVHETTGDPPVERFQPKAMQPLPEPACATRADRRERSQSGLWPDCRDTEALKVHSDFSIRFDANNYTVPPWAIGKQVVAKADHHTITIYFKDKPIAVHNRSWERRKRIELPEHKEAARRHKNKYWLSQEVAAFVSLGEEAKIYLENLAATHQPLKKNVKKLLALKNEYGSLSLIEAVKRAISHRAYGADYIENILFQEMTPKNQHPPVKLKQEELNRIQLEEPQLAEYDALVIKRRKDRE